MAKRNQQAPVTTLVPNEAGDLVKQEVTLSEAQAEDTAAAAAETKAKRGKRELNVEDPFNKQVITLLRKENPKRKGSKSFARFALYVDGMSVADFLKAGGTRGDINWDVAHEHISLTPAVAAE
jgi:hypothetical protein